MVKNVAIVPGWPWKHAKDYTPICRIITAVQAIFPYKHTVMSGKSTYITTSSLIVRRLFPWVNDNIRC